MRTQMLATATAVAGLNLGGKHLTFALGEESYAVDVRKVREIIRLASITTVPQMPAFICVVKMLLDLDRVLGSDEVQALNQAAPTH